MSDSLKPLPAVMIRQEAQYLEVLCPAFERKNKYALKPFNASQDATDTEFKSLPSMWQGTEESGLCCRLCCGPYREFNMDWRDAKGNVQMSMFRPFQFSCICVPFCCCQLAKQELIVKDASGQAIGRVVEDWKWFDFFCIPGMTQYYNILDADGNKRYRVRLQKPALCNGLTNCCAPTCFNRTFEIDVFDASDANVVGGMKAIWPGFKCPRILSTATNMVVNFPPEAEQSPNDKALLIGAMMLLEYLHFEKKATE